MNELLEYKNMFLNYPRTNIKEMANLLKQNKKEEFMKAYMHNIYLFASRMYNTFPSYFEYNDVMDIIGEGNEFMAKLYNKGIRDYKAYTFRMYYLFYNKIYHKIAVTLIVKDTYDEFVQTNGRSPKLKELYSLTGIKGWDITRQDALYNCKSDLEENKVEDTIIETLEKNAKTESIKQTIKELTNEQKEIFYQRYAHYMTYREIGEAYNRSHEWVRLEDKKIRQKVLTKYYNNNGDFYEEY